MTKAVRAIIYARYSTDLQSAASIEDQIEVCRRYAERHGWQVTDVYADRAVSGASRFRPDLVRLMSDAEANRFDVVVAEALDRLGRKLADVAGLFDQLTFRKIAVHTVATGPMTAMHVGMLGTMAQMQLSDLRDKTRRGMLGRALAGHSPGGRAFGYRVVAGDERGLRKIDETEAAVVRRIFEAFAVGNSPRAIAKQLNAEGVPGPDGRPWGDTTIRGQAERGTGILNNALYAGRIEWNRCSYVKDPSTGKRVARPNPRPQWEIVAVPDLRIVDDDLWDRVRQRQTQLAFAVRRDDAGNALNRAHRRKFLLSGLLVCGCCGGGYTIVGSERYGCAKRRSAGLCGNDRTIMRHELEARVLGGLKERLMAPELVEAFIAEFNATLAEAAGSRRQETAQAQSRLAATERKIASILKAVEDGLYNPSMKQRLTALETEKAELQQQLAAVPAVTPIVPHPNLPAVYRRKVERLTETLDDPTIRTEAMEVVRSLIDRIVLHPRAGGGLDIQLHGDLVEILALCEERTPKSKPPADGLAGGILSVVAGARFELTTFR